MTRINIADGINLNIIRSDKFKTNYLSVNFTLPLNERNAAYSTLLTSVLRRGCEKYPTMNEFNRALEYLYATVLGGSTTKIGENQSVTFKASFLRNEFIPDGSDLLSDVLALTADFLFRPYLVDGAFCKEYVESEKVNLCDRINAEINNKGSYAVKRLFDIMCENEAYSVSHLGTVENVSAIDEKSLYEFYRSSFACAPVEIFFVGTCDDDLLCDKVRAYFAPYARNAVGYTDSAVVKAVGSLKRVTEEMPVNQGKLTIGFRTGAWTKNGKGTDFLVFNEIFGGSPTSKLFENVREKLSLCYYCSSRFASPKGIMYITSGVKVGDETKAEEEILRQLDSMRKGEFSDSDIEEAKLSLTNSYLSCYDDADKLASWYVTRIITGAEMCDIESVIEKVNAVDRDSITAIASTVIPDTVYFLKGTNLDDGEEADDEE